jgi:NAD(P)-dependent dehydrogenase (short-subunit alcohol dehydrogenase family)
MSASLRFDGRVAIVTGAGNSLGRAQALLLASKGAKVVVNDLGTSPDGKGSSQGPAQAVVAKIRAAGGEAVADTHSIAEEESAREIVQTALEAFGKVDVVINMAGIYISALFEEITSEDLWKVINVDLMGTMWMCKAVWPHMKAAGYGRIVTNSSGPAKRAAFYGAAKWGVQAFTEGLAAEGQEHGIYVNCIHPSAGTRPVLHMIRDSDWRRFMVEEMTPERVAPTALLLAHERCPVNGKTFVTGGGGVGLRKMTISGEYYNPAITMEDLLENFDRVFDPVEPSGPWRRSGLSYEFVPYVPGGREYTGTLPGDEERK